MTTATEAQLWANFHRLNEGDKDLVIHVVREIKERDRAKAVHHGSGIGTGENVAIRGGTRIC